MSSEHKVKQIGIAITLVSYSMLVARAVCHMGHGVLWVKSIRVGVCVLYNVYCICDLTNKILLIMQLSFKSNQIKVESVSHVSIHLDYSK